MKYAAYLLAAAAVYLWVWTALSAEYRRDAGTVGVHPFSRIEELLK